MTIVARDRHRLSLHWFFFAVNAVEFQGVSKNYAIYESPGALFDWFDKLPKEEQQVQLRRLDHLAQLTPEQRAEVMGMIVEVNALPGPRSGAIKQALYRLHHMTDPQRDGLASTSSVTLGGGSV
jgi:hypothetical protein